MLGIILFNLGGPETLADVKPFLYNLFSDPEIIRLPIRALQKPLAWWISTTRNKKSTEIYRQIGGGSPLRKITDEQANALQEELKNRGIEAKVYVGMRYWHPFTNEALHKIQRDKITELIALPLYPQYSVSSSGASLKDFIAQLRQLGGLRQIRRRYITHWYRNEAYIATLAAQIKEAISQFPDTNPANIHLLFSAHSIPQSYVERGDPYLRHTEETVRLVMAKLENCSPSHLSFQSKVGPVKWLRPSTEEKIRELHANGVNQLLMIPISFVSEHSETLYELDIQYKIVADEIGLNEYRRVPAFNSDPRFISALADLVEGKITQ